MSTTLKSGSEAKRRMRLGLLISGAAAAASGLLGQEIPAPASRSPRT